MDQSYRQRACRAALIAVAAATVLVAALLIARCAGVYLTGTSAENMTAAGVRIRDIYSREIVAESFSRISWAFVAWLIAVAAALVARAIARGGKEERLEIPLENRLRLVSSRREPTDGMRAERKKRAVAAVFCAVACAACAAMVGRYMFDLNRFASRDLEKTVGEMLVHITPWIAAAFACAMLLTFYNAKSMNKEIELAKDAPKRKPEPLAERSNTPVIVLRAAVCVAAAALIVAGIMNGGMYDVLVKAVNICTECIGLG